MDALSKAQPEVSAHWTESVDCCYIALHYCSYTAETYANSDRFTSSTAVFRPRLMGGLLAAGARTSLSRDSIDVNTYTATSLPTADPIPGWGSSSSLSSSVSTVIDVGESRWPYCEFWVRRNLTLEISAFLWVEARERENNIG